MSSSAPPHTLRTQGLGIRFGAFQAVSEVNPVSYTHLTLPTILRV